jgi:hypothetical protein
MDLAHGLSGLDAGREMATGRIADGAGRRLRLSSLGLASFVAVLGGLEAAHAKVMAPVPARELPMPPEHRTLLTLAPDVGVAARDGARLIVLPRRELWGSTAAFDPTGATREAVFGKVSAMSRQKIYEAETSDHVWVGVDAGANGGKSLLLLDGNNFILFQSDPANWKEVLRRTVAWDRALPPRDRGGEATTPETAEMRALLLKQWKGTAGQKIAGMAVLPASWDAGSAKSRVYAVATRVAGFPLLLMECDLEDPSSCKVTRACPLGQGEAGSAGGAPLPGSVAGVAVDTASPKERRLLVGDKDAHRIVAYHFASCLGSRRVATYALPPKLKELTNVTTDADGGLWVTTRAADDYLNASVYWWPKGEW